MCKAVEEYAKKCVEAQRPEIERIGIEKGERETKIKMIRNLLEENVPFEIALKCAGIDKQTYEKFIGEIRQ